MILETVVPNVAFVTARDSGAESGVSADVRPLVTPDMAKAGVVDVSPMFDA